MSLVQLSEVIRQQGRGPDNVLVHMTSGELAGMQGLARAAGGTLTVNPVTGLPEASFLRNLLPTILGFGANFLLPGSGAAIGALSGAALNRDNPLMGAALGGIGGWGGGKLATGLQGMGASAAQAAAAPAAHAASQAAMEAALSNSGAAIGQGVQQGVAGLGLQQTGGLGLQAAGAAPMHYQTTLSGAGLQGLGNQAAANVYQQAAADFAAQPFQTRLLQSVTAPFQPGSGGLGAFTREMGGMQPTMRAAGAAVAPVLVGNMGAQPQAEEEQDAEDLGGRYRFDAGYTGGLRTPGAPYSSERRWFNPQFTPTTRFAEGGLASLAPDAGVQATGLSQGGFVIPADVVSIIGDGNTEAGFRRLAAALPGAQPIPGPDGGQADTVDTHIDGQQAAQVAHGEVYVPPEVVAQAGGAERMYALVASVRKQATGRTQQIPPVNLAEIAA